MALLKTIRFSPWSLVWLTVVWMLLWGSYEPMTILGGLLAAFVVLVVFPLPPIDLKVRFRPIATTILLIRFLTDLVIASFHVAWLAVRPWETPRGLVMDLQLKGDDELLQTITAEMVALVPGSVVIELDSSDRVLTLHAIGVTTRSEAELVRHRVLAQEARVIRAFHPDPGSVLGPGRRDRPSLRDLIPLAAEPSTIEEGVEE